MLSCEGTSIITIQPIFANAIAEQTIKRERNFEIQLGSHNYYKGTMVTLLFYCVPLQYNSLVCSFSDLYFTSHSTALSATGNINCVTKQAVARHTIPNNSSNNFTTVNANANLHDSNIIYQC